MAELSATNPRRSGTKSQIRCSLRHAKKELMDSLPGDKSDVKGDVSIDDISIPKMQGIRGRRGEVRGQGAG